MLKYVLAGTAALMLLGSAAVYAQPWSDRGDDFGRGQHWRMGPGMMEGRMGPGMGMGHGMGMGGRFGRMNAEDAAAFIDARIASVKAGLQLNAEQEKLWPPVEAAVRDFAKQRMLRANAMGPAAGADNPKSAGGGVADDPITLLRKRAEFMAEMATGLSRIAESADPLYKTLDDTQKRRLTMLTRMGGGNRMRP